MVGITVVIKVNIALNITKPQNIGITRSVNKLLKFNRNFGKKRILIATSAGVNAALVSPDHLMIHH